MKKNKKYVPQEMAPSKLKEEFSTVFRFHEKVTMYSYAPKRNKAVTMVSTMHADATVSNDFKKKPENIEYYSKNKIGVDTMN